MSQQALSAGPVAAVREEETNRTREWKKFPIQSGRLGAKAATDNTKLKWTRQITLPALVWQGVDATVMATGRRGEDTLLADMMVLRIKWPK